MMTLVVMYHACHVCWACWGCVTVVVAGRGWHWRAGWGQKAGAVLYSVVLLEMIHCAHLGSSRAKPAGLGCAKCEGKWACSMLSHG